VRGHSVAFSLYGMLPSRGPIDPEADRKNSATRQCGSIGTGGCDAFMKLCVSSSRCESCPAKGEPARAGSQPCDGARNDPGDA
jgi:hypothetical protein